MLDGIVERDDGGMEVRYPVVLSQAEKLIAAKVLMGPPEIHTHRAHHAV